MPHVAHPRVRRWLIAASVPIVIGLTAIRFDAQAPPRVFGDVDGDVKADLTLLVQGAGYSVYLYLRANEPAQAFVGVRPNDSTRFVLDGDEFQRLLSESAFRDRATHAVRLNRLRGELTFHVLDRETGKRYEHSFKVGSINCVCKTYDGL